MDGVMEREEGRRTRGLDRAIEILDHLRSCQTPLKPNEIAVHLGAPRSTVYELVNLLLRNGMLEAVGGEGRVFLGRRLYFLGAAYEHHFDFTRQCETVLERLAEETRETAQFCMLDGDKYTVVRLREGARPFRISTDQGKRVPIPWTASGRLLVAHLSDAEILALIPDADFTLPTGDRLEPSEFLRQVRAAQVDGYFSFESIVDSFTRCFAVPIYDRDRRVAATLCLVAPRSDGAANHEAYVAALTRAAHSLGPTTVPRLP